MKQIKNSVYKPTWVPDHCNDLGIEVYNADNWQDNLLHNVLRVVTTERRGVAIERCNTAVMYCKIVFFFNKKRLGSW